MSPKTKSAQELRGSFFTAKLPAMLTPAGASNDSKSENKPDSKRDKLHVPRQLLFSTIKDQRSSYEKTKPRIPELQQFTDKSFRHETTDNTSFSFDFFFFGSG